MVIKCIVLYFLFFKSCLGVSNKNKIYFLPAIIMRGILKGRFILIHLGLTYKSLNVEVSGLER